MDLLTGVFGARATVSTTWPSDLPVPFVHVGIIGGASDRPDLLDRASVEFQTWAADQATAQGMMFEVRAALRESASSGVAYGPHGVISGVRETARPIPIPVDVDEPDAVRRYRMAATVRLRPTP